MKRVNRTTKVGEYWEKEHVRIGTKAFGAHSDPSVVELENWFVESHLRRLRPRSAIEIGCGNGQRTALFSRHVRGKTLGVDYSKTAIHFAKRLENTRLRFEQWDLEGAPRWSEPFDCAIMCRVLINLQTLETQLRAIDTLHSLLKRNGSLILCECSEQGHRTLNRLRAQFGLHPIKTAWHNVNLQEPTFLKKLSKKFRIQEMTRFGLYYVLTRVVHPLLVAPSEPDPNNRINMISARLQMKLRDESRGLEAYGRHLALVATRL